MKPIFKVNGHDYTRYLASDGLKPSTNDLDKDGAGRNILNGLMYRKKIGTKVKWTVSFNRLDEAIMSQLQRDMSSEYVRITLLDSGANRHMERVYYSSTINCGVQRYINGRTVYDGVTFNITER